MTSEGTALCRASIAHYSKSFAMASRLLPGDTADRAAVVYAWCRRADDAVDGAPRAEQAGAIARLRAELDDVYAGVPQPDPELHEFQRVVERCCIPRVYPEELLDGMQMDCDGTDYATRDDLLVYCYRVAGTVGLMMSHIMGVRDPSAFRRAADLGIAMQLTNICRDVLEDWEMGRLYLPDELLDACGAPGLRSRLGGPLPDDARAPLAKAVRATLDDAERYYRSGDAGLGALSWRCALAVRAARLIYAAIGRRIERQRCDVTAGRAFVTRTEKLALVARACAHALVEWPARAAGAR